MPDSQFASAVLTARRDIHAEARAPGRRKALMATLTKMKARHSVAASAEEKAALKLRINKIQQTLSTINEHGVERPSDRPVGFFANSQART